MAVLLPSDVDAANPTFDYGTDGKNVNDTGVDIATSSDGLTYVIANGVPIVIDAGEVANTTDVSAVINDESVLVKTFESGTKLMIVGGSLGADAKIGAEGNDGISVATSSITMKGGAVQEIIGGGIYNSTVGSATIVINGGTMDRVSGGGWAGSNPYNGDASDADSVRVFNCTTNANITVNGGDINVLIGGGRFSYAYVGTTNVDVNGGTIGELIAGGINGITDNSTVTIDGAVIVGGGYSYEGATGYGLITAANRGEVGTANITINSLGEGSKALVTVGALSDATYTDGGTNAVVKNVTLNVPNEIDAIFLLGSTVNNNNNPWYGADVTTTSPTMTAVINFNAPGQTLIAQDLTNTANQDNSKVYNLDGSLTLAETAKLYIPNGMTVNGKISVDGEKPASVDVENLTAGADGITLTAGSISISGAIDAAQNVMITAEGKVSIDGTIVDGSTGNLTIETTGEGNDVTIGDLTIPAEATLIIADGASVDITGTVTTTGKMYVAGTVTVSGNGAISDATKVTVDANTGVVPEDITANVVTNYNLLGNIAIGITSGNGWAYENGTLTLTNFNGKGYFYDSGLKNVVLVGENTITLDQDSADSASISQIAAIRNNTEAGTDLTLKSNGTDAGSLQIVIPEGVAVDGKTISAIYSQNGKLVVDGVALETTAQIVLNGESKSVTVSNGGAATVGDITSVTGNTVTITGNVAVGTIGAEGVQINVVNGNLVADTIVGKLNVDAQSTVMVGALTVSDYKNEGYVVVSGSISYTNDSTLQLITGIESNPVPGSTYFTGRAANIHVSMYVLASPENPVDANTQVVNFLDGDVSAGTNVVVIAIQADLGGKTIAGNVTVAGAATGSVVMNGGTLTVGTASGLTTGNATFTGIENLSISGTGDNIAVSSNIVSGTVSLDAPAEAGKGTVVTFESGVKVTTMTLTMTDGNAVTLNGITAGTNGMTVSYGSIDLGGDIVVEGQAVMDGGKLTLNNANVTGTGTISVDELTIEGTVTIGEGIVIELAPGTADTRALLVIEKNAVLTGDGIVNIADKETEQVYGSIVNNGGTIDVEVQTPASGIEVSNSAEFVAALPYYNNIRVSDNFAEGVVTIGSDVNVAGTPTAFTTIDLNGKNLVISKDADVVMTNVTLKNAGTDGIEVFGSLDINSSYIYANVTAGTNPAEQGKEPVMGTVTVTTPLETHLQGDAGFPTVDIGYGNILYVETNMTIQGQSAFTVYGSLVVAEGSTLTAAGQSITVEKSGTIEVAGTMAAQCAMTVNGTIEVAGTMTVDGTAAVTGEIAVTGTMTVNAKGSVTGAGIVSVAAGAELAMNGTSATNIVDKGTVTVNGTVNGTTVTIYSGATLNIEKAAGTMTVNDTGTVEDYKAPEGTTVAVNPIQDGNQIVLTDSAGYVITVDIVDKETTDGTTKIQYQAAVMDVAGTAVEGTAIATPAVGLTVSDSLDIAKGSFTINGTVPVEITGTVTVAAGADLISNVGLTVTGTVKVSEATAADAKISGTGKVTATYYDETTPAAGDVAAYVTKTYTTFDAAVAAIAGADNTTVTVSGEQTNEVSAEITGTVVVPSGDKLTIGKDSVLTFTAQGYMLNGNTTNKMIVVEGTLVFQAYVNYSEGTTATTTAVENPQIYADVAIIDGAARTYTSLANAIDMAAGEETTITLNQDVAIKDDLTIPANITVASSQYGITVGETTSVKDVTLTVEGAVEFSGASNVITLAKGAAIEGAAADAQKKDYHGDMVLAGNGYVYSQAEAALDGVTVDGAYYDKTIVVPATTTTAASSYDVHVISTVEYAAADSANVKTDATNAGLVTIKGTVEVGDVAFAVPKAASEDVTTTLSIVMNTGASMTVSSMTIVPGVTVNGTAGTITGSVASTVGTVDLDKVTGITVVSVAATTGTNATPEMLTIAGTVTGDVTVSAGTVTVGTAGVTVQNPADERSSSSLTVAADATLDVDGTVTTGTEVPVSITGIADVSGTFEINGEATVAGTVTDKGTVKFNGKATINGTVNVIGTAKTAESNEVIAELTIVNGNIAGTIDANEYSNVTITAVVTGTVNTDGTVKIEAVLGDLGEGSYELGTALAGELNFGAGANITDAAIKAYYGTTVTGLGDSVKSTTYNINGQAYMTVYFLNINGYIKDVVYTEKFDLTEGGLALDTGLYYGDDDNRNTGLYDPANWFTTSNMRPNTLLTGNEMVGDAANVYAAAETVPVTVTITVTDGLTLYIDGIPYASGVYEMSVGTHSVFVNATAGFKADEATISYGGQTVTTGTATGTVEIQADAQNAVILATGAVQTSGDITIDVPSQDQPVVNVNTGDDKLSLTDYLLIVLVILIVIMAIIVALRLMRS